MSHTPFLTDILLHQQNKNKSNGHQNQFVFNLNCIPEMDIFFVSETQHKTDQTEATNNNSSNDIRSFLPRNHPIPDIFKEIKKISLTKKDLESLGSHRWLNDEIINSYLTYLHNTHIESRIGYTNTFFYVTLKQNGNEYANKWGGIFGYRVDIFSHFLIPITTGAHWFLIDLDFDSQTMNVYDSMSHRYNSYTNKIMEFLAFQGIPQIEVNYPSVPKQTTHYDCGVFLLRFATMIYEDKPIKKNSFNQRDITTFRSKVKEILSKSVCKK